VRGILNINDESELIDRIVDIEWRMFSSVQNKGGRASCQEDPETFKIMRISQFKTWSRATLQSYYSNLREAENTGINLMTEKYARMMKSTMSTEYRKFKHLLQPLIPEVHDLIEKILEIEIKWQEDFSKKYPCISQSGRPIRSSNDSTHTVSIETYLRGELETYSKTTLELYYQDVKDHVSQKINRPELVYNNQVKYYGYNSLKDAEAVLQKRRQSLPQG
jgi:hypothetical protein